tara:strand:- start:562 stop:936 length:375 start_codon:yes stop_codon:yes gene_type:complete
MSVIKKESRLELGKRASKPSHHIRGIKWRARTTKKIKIASYRTGIQTQPLKGVLGYKPSAKGLFKANRIGRAYKGEPHHIMLPTLDPTYAQASTSQTIDEIKQKIADDHIYYVRENGITYIPED